MTEQLYFGNCQVLNNNNLNNKTKLNNNKVRSRVIKAMKMLISFQFQKLNSKNNKKKINLRFNLTNSKWMWMKEINLWLLSLGLEQLKNQVTATIIKALVRPLMLNLSSNMHMDTEQRIAETT